MCALKCANEYAYKSEKGEEEHKVAAVLLIDMNTDDLLSIYCLLFSVLDGSESANVLLILSGCLGKELDVFKQMLCCYPSDKSVNIYVTSDKSTFITKKSRFDNGDKQTFEAIRNRWPEVNPNVTIKEAADEYFNTEDLFVLAPFSVRPVYWNKLRGLKYIFLGIGYNSGKVVQADEQDGKRGPVQTLAHMKALFEKFPAAQVIVWNGYGSISRDIGLSYPTNLGKLRVKDVCEALWSLVKFPSLHFAMGEYADALELWDGEKKLFVTLTPEDGPYVEEVFMNAYKLTGESYYATNALHATRAQIFGVPEDELSDVVSIVFRYSPKHFMNSKVFHPCDLKANKYFVEPEFREDGRYLYIRFDDEALLSDFVHDVVHLLMKTMKL